MNKKIILKLIIFLAILFCILFCLGLFVTPKTVYTKIIKGFYEEPKDSLDVVFFGDSTIYKGISPLEIWKEEGITSYDFGSPTQRVWDSYYSAEEVLNYQKPKVIAIDTNEFFKETPMKKAYQTHLYGNMKFGKAKISGITDSIQKNGISVKLSFLLPVFRFHSRWSELEESDFVSYNETYPNVFKGFNAVTDVKPFKKNKNLDDEFNNQITANTKQYLKKIKELACQNNAKLLLLSCPNPKTWNDEKNDEIKKWAKENNVDYINMNTKKIVKINWKEDTGDAGSHLNVSGAKKVSNYIAKYLKENYNLDDHRKEQKYQSWNDELKRYEKYIKDKK